MFFVKTLLYVEVPKYYVVGNFNKPMENTETKYTCGWMPTDEKGPQMGLIYTIHVTVGFLVVSVYNCSYITLEDQNLLQIQKQLVVNNLLLKKEACAFLENNSHWKTHCKNHYISKSYKNVTAFCNINIINISACAYGIHDISGINVKKQ